MATSGLSVPARSTLRRWFLVLVVAGLAVTAVAGVLAYDAHTGDHTTVEEHSAGSWTVDSEFEHGAVVETDTTTFQAGQRLENRQLYFTSITPTLETTYTVSHANTDAETATASVTLTLVVRSVETIDGQEVVHWENRTELARAERTDLAAGDEATLEATVGIEAVTDRIDAIEGELGATPGTSEVLIRATADVSSSLAGDPVSDTRTDRLSISPETGVYRVETDTEPSSSTTATEEVTVTDEPSALWLYGLPALGGTTLLGVLTLVVVRVRGELEVTDAERTRHRFETDRAEFDRWISGGQVPDLGDRTTISVGTLEDLVDIAIDSDRRVLEDSDEDQFVVLVDDIAYRFRPPATGERGARADIAHPGEDGDTGPTETEDPTTGDESDDATGGHDGSPDTGDRGPANDEETVDGLDIDDNGV